MQGEAEAFGVHRRFMRKAKRTARISFVSKLLLASFIFFLYFSAFTIPSARATSVTTMTQSSSSDSNGVLIFTRGDFCYGIILTPQNGSSDAIKFSFTYNNSLPVQNMLQIYNYTTTGELKLQQYIACGWDPSGFHYVYVCNSGAQLCRLRDEGIQDEFGVDYVEIRASSQESGWNSGYNVGVGVAALIKGTPQGADISGGTIGAATAVALTITSFIPFFMLLPDATKKLCHAVDEAAGDRAGNGKTRSLYVRLLAIFAPLLSIGVVCISLTAMLLTLTG